MFIHEAISATTRQKPYITRQAWDYPVDIKLIKSFGRSIRLLPTNSPDGVVVYSATGGVKPRWQPTMDDLVADDWLSVC